MKNGSLFGETDERGSGHGVTFLPILFWSRFRLNENIQTLTARFLLLLQRAGCLEPVAPAFPFASIAIQFPAYGGAPLLWLEKAFQISSDFGLMNSGTASF